MRRRTDGSLKFPDKIDDLIWTFGTLACGVTAIDVTLAPRTSIRALHFHWVEFLVIGVLAPALLISIARAPGRFGDAVRFGSAGAMLAWMIVLTARAGRFDAMLAAFLTTAALAALAQSGLIALPFALSTGVITIASWLVVTTTASVYGITPSGIVSPWSPSLISILIAVLALVGWSLFSRMCTKSFPAKRTRVLLCLHFCHNYLCRWSISSISRAQSRRNPSYVVLGRASRTCAVGSLATVGCAVAVWVSKHPNDSLDARRIDVGCAKSVRVTPHFHFSNFTVLAADTTPYRPNRLRISDGRLRRHRRPCSRRKRQFELNVPHVWSLKVFLAVRYVLYYKRSIYCSNTA